MGCPVGAGSSHMWVGNGKGGMTCAKCGMKVGPQ